MKNIHVLPTDKASRLFVYDGKLGLAKEFQYGSDAIQNQNIYITSDEEIKEENYWIYISPPKWKDTDRIEVVRNVLPNSWFCKLYDKENYKKIILTTDQDLIKDGVQAIDDEFLEWFVNNPSCEEIYVNKIESFDFEMDKYVYDYKIIIPKEVDVLELGQIVPKEETALEEAAEKYDSKFVNRLRPAFIAGAKYQQEQDKNKYSEEDMRKMYDFGSIGHFTENESLEQFKKK